MKVLDLEHVEAQFELMLREKDNHENHILIRLEDLDSIISYYSDFKKELKK